jgi:hypothetical protein
MKKFLKIIPLKKRKQLLLPETDAAGSSDASEDQSTSNPTLPASSVTSHPFGCEILFEGVAPIAAE